MGLLDYYRQFEGLSDEEVSEQLRARSEERRRRALARIDPLDLSATTWHEMPHPYVVNAITFQARRGLNRPSDPQALELRRELGRRFGLEPERVAVGNGASTLLRVAARLLMDPDDELVTPWPSYPLYPLMARASGGRAVPSPAKTPTRCSPRWARARVWWRSATPTTPPARTSPWRSCAACSSACPST